MIDRVRKAFVHRLVVEPAADFDDRAPGGAVTRELCGAWDHEGPCTVPHHSATRVGDERHVLRVVFAVEANLESAIRARIFRAVDAGAERGPDGRASRWELVEQGPDEVTAAEMEMADSWLTS